MSRGAELGGIDDPLFRVKAPAEFRSRWDVHAHAATIPLGEAFRPLGQNGCLLVPK